MKIKDRDIAVLLVVASIAMVALVYFFVFTKFNEKRDTVIAENETLQADVTKLEGMVAKEDEVKADTTAKTDDINDIISMFPSETRTQNVIKTFYDMYHSEIKSVDIESEAFSMNAVFFSGGVADAAAEATTGEETELTAADILGTAVEEGAETETVDAFTTEEIIERSNSFVGYLTTVNLVFSTSYEGIKKVIDYINENDDRMVISNINIAPGETGNRYSVTLGVNIYTLGGTGKDYEPPVIRGIKDGTPNIFR